MFKFNFILSYFLFISFISCYTNPLLNYSSYECDLSKCPLERGVCTKDNHCFCHQGYVSVESECDYQQKNQFVFLLLEFLLSFGIGHFYAERYYFGLIKLSFDVAVMSVYCCCHALNKSEKAIRKEGIIRIILMLLFTIWQVVDAIAIGKKIYKDGNGIELSEWF